MTLQRIYRAEAIILKRKNVGEADRILTVFSKQYGKLRLIAKGIRKITSHRAPHLEIFSQAEMMIHHGKTLDIITEAQTLRGFYQLRNNLALVNGCYYYCELVDFLLPEKQQHPDVYELFAQSLQALNSEEDIDIARSCEQFALGIVRMLGFLPLTRDLPSNQIQPFIESISERHMKTYHFLRRA